MGAFAKEIRKASFWIATFAEFLSTFIFVFLGIGSATAWNKNQPPSVEHISLGFGLSIATLAVTICHLSGGLINPAVTIAQLITRKISIVRAILFLIAQVVGGIAGAALLYGVLPSNVRGSLGVNRPAHGVTVGQAFAVELVLTFLLVLTVFGCTDPLRSHYGYEVPLAIGLCVAVCHLVGIGFTGCGINPARSFGPAVIMNKWDDHWIFWVAPILGGVLAAFLYELLLKAKEEQLPAARVSIRKTSDTNEQNSRL